jgi:integrase
MLRLNVPLTSYVARHSWATTAKEEGVALAMISEGLGHSSEKVTHVYLASFNNNAMSKANRKVISTIHSKEKKRKSKK